jgi:hypothetical protein
MKYSDFNLSINTDYKTVSVFSNDINIIKYLSIEDKNNII